MFDISKINLKIISIRKKEGYIPPRRLVTTLTSEMYSRQQLIYDIVYDIKIEL